MTCFSVLFGFLGWVFILKMNGPPKLAYAILFIPMGITFLIQLLGLLIASMPAGLGEVTLRIILIGLIFLLLGPSLYINRKLSDKIKLAEEEFINAVLFMTISSFLFGIGVTIATLSNEWPLVTRSELLTEITLHVGLILIMLTVFFATTVKLQQRRQTKVPWIAYKLPDWFLRLFDPFYIPPYNKGQRKDRKKN